MLRKYIILLTFLLLSSGNIKAEPINDLTIIVSSCDKYEECWIPFCTLLQRYWPGLLAHNKHIPVILITNEIDFTFPGIQVFKAGKDKGWSDNMLAALESVTTKNVLYMQEDYFLSSPLNEAMLKSYVEVLNQEKVGYVGLTFDHFFNDQKVHPLYNEAVVKPRFLHYRTSLQPALWNKDLLKWLIKPGENPWKFEIDGSARSDGSPYEFIALAKNYAFTFVNACQAGFWSQGALDFLAKEGLAITDTKLPIKEDYPVTFWVRDKFPKYYPYWAKFMRIFDSKI